MATMTVSRVRELEEELLAHLMHIKRTFGGRAAV